MAYSILIVDDEQLNNDNIRRLVAELEPSAIICEASSIPETLARATATDNINPANYLYNRLAISHQQGIKFITLKDIVYLEANNTYTIIMLANGEKITTSKPIIKFEHTLSSHWFFRIHKSHIINIDHFKEYISHDGDIALMSNGDKLCISRYRLTEFISVVSNTTGRMKV